MHAHDTPSETAARSEVGECKAKGQSSQLKHPGMQGTDRVYIPDLTAGIGIQAALNPELPDSPETNPGFRPIIPASPDSRFSSLSSCHCQGQAIFSLGGNLITGGSRFIRTNKKSTEIQIERAE